MATTPIEFRCPTGLTLTAKLYTAADALVTTFSGGTAPAERTNAKGRYTVDETGATTGHHTLHVYSGANLIAVFDYILADTTAVHFPHIAAGSPANITTEGTILSSD